jgi:type I restriction enzyme R subunit
MDTVSGGVGGTPEDRARQKIDKLLEAAGWAVQDRQDFDPRVSRGIAVREHPLETGSADYLLFVDRAVVGVLEAKPEGTTLSGVSEQTQKYLASKSRSSRTFRLRKHGHRDLFQGHAIPLPSLQASFHLHRPETLDEWLSKEDTLRARLGNMPSLEMGSLRDCQYEAIQG